MAVPAGTDETVPYIEVSCVDAAGRRRQRPPQLRHWDVRFALERPRLTTTEPGQLGDPITGEPADLIESMIARGHNGLSQVI